MNKIVPEYFSEEMLKRRVKIRPAAQSLQKEIKISIRQLIAIDEDVIVIGLLSLTNGNLKGNDLRYFAHVVEVRGDFHCDNNQLTTLEYTPKEIGGYFYCTNNLLISLEGSPVKVGGSINCSGNQLVSLKGVTLDLGGSFLSMGNPVEFDYLKYRAKQNAQGSLPKLMTTSSLELHSEAESTQLHI